MDPGPLTEQEVALVLRRAAELDLAVDGTGPGPASTWPCSRSRPWRRGCPGSRCRRRWPSCGRERCRRRRRRLSRPAACWGRRRSPSAVPCPVPRPTWWPGCGPVSAGSCSGCSGSGAAWCRGPAGTTCGRVSAAPSTRRSHKRLSLTEVRRMEAGVTVGTGIRGAAGAGGASRPTSAACAGTGGRGWPPAGRSGRCMTGGAVVLGALVDPLPAADGAGRRGRGGRRLRDRRQVLPHPRRRHRGRPGGPARRPGGAPGHVVMRVRGGRGGGGHRRRVPDDHVVEVDHRPREEGEGEHGQPRPGPRPPPPRSAGPARSVGGGTRPA